VTVLFADVANYTAMSEKLDPEDIHQIMDTCFQILLDEIHRCEGTINQFTGDGVMALFGAPVAHEDHAQRACHAAITILRALKSYADDLKKKHGIEFQMRIGLNSGPVVVGAIGDDLRMDYTAMGDTTNLAARMESAAEPGTIVAAANTYKLAQGYFDFEPLGKLQLKGKQAPQEAYLLIRPTDVATRLEVAAARGLTRFVGRTREVDTLAQAYEKAIGGSGQVVGIVGDAGVGKSRLLYEFRKTTLSEPCTYLEGRCLHYGGSMPYLPLLDVLRSYFDIEESDQEQDIKNKVAEKLARLHENLTACLPSFQDILSLRVDDERYPQIDPGEKKVRVFEALRNLFIRESQNNPLVIAIEDLHWIDKTSEAFISYLIDWLSGSRILLILLYRPEYTHQWGSKSYYSKLGVGQLSGKSSIELVRAALEEGDVAPKLKALILGRAGGNPLFIEEFTQSLLENGSIERKDKKYVLTRDASEIHVPETIQALIAARIDRIEDNMKRVMQMASVIGREFAFRILQNIMEMKADLKSNLLNLQGLEFIHEKRLFPELEYIFKHALTQEVAYNSLLQKRQKEIHEKIGRAIEALYPDRLEEYFELLAYQYGRSANKDKAYEYCNLSNRKAIKLNALEDAMAYFNEAMQLLDTLTNTEENRERRISIIVHNNDVFQLQFMGIEYHEILKNYEQTAVDLDQPDMLGAFYARLGGCGWWMGEYEQAIQTLNKAIELCDVAGNAEYAGFALMALQWSYLDRSNFDKVLTLKKEALQRLDQHFSLRVYLYVLTAVTMVHKYMGCWDKAISEGQIALKTAEEFSDNSTISFAAFQLSYVHLEKRDISLAIKYASYAVDKASTPADKSWAQDALAVAWIKSGEIDKGIQFLASKVQAYEAVNWIFGVIYLKTYLGEGYWLKGMYDEAKQTIAESLELASRYGFRFYIAFSNRILGEILRITSMDQAPAH
ncbi:AAA family ATPase, partial [Desulfosarcina sp.]|nr:AAA family ATPase [Desulfosarcina sp.]